MMVLLYCCCGDEELLLLVIVVDAVVTVVSWRIVGLPGRVTRRDGSVRRLILHVSEEPQMTGDVLALKDHLRLS